MAKNNNGAAAAKDDAPKKKRHRFKELFSELKKVTWPSFMTVLKQTGVVLLVTLCFLVVLTGIDALFGWLYNLLLGGLTSGLPAETAAFGSLMSASHNISLIGGVLL